MLTKTLQFDGEVLDALRYKTTWSADGKSCQIEPLERKLYERVAKALKAMGGTWKGGKTQATVFDEDPRAQVEGLLQNGTVVVERDGFFETPPKVVKKMIELADIKGHDILVLEPEAGMAAIASQLRKLQEEWNDNGDHFGLHVCEKNEKRASFLAGSKYYVAANDFLQYDPGEVYDYILMNPPFEEGQDCVHVMHAYNMLKGGGTLVAVVADNKHRDDTSKYKLFKEWLATKKPYTEKLPKDAFKESRANVNTMIIVLHKPATRIEQIAQGDPNKKATQAAKRVLEKRAARKAGIQPISQAETVDLNEKGTGKSTKERSTAKAVKQNDNLTVLAFKGKDKGKVFVKTLPDGKQMLSGGEPLPSARTKQKPAISSNVVDEMNERWRAYGYHHYYATDAVVDNAATERRDKQVRQDFANYGAQDARICFDPYENNDNPYSQKKGKKAQRGSKR